MGKGFACIFELLAENLYILSQTKIYYIIRVYTEPAATLLCCLTTYIFIKGHILKWRSWSYLLCLRLSMQPAFSLDIGHIFFYLLISKLLMFFHSGGQPYQETDPPRRKSGC